MQMHMNVEDVVNATVAVSDRSIARWAVGASVSINVGSLLSASVISTQ